VPGTSFSPNCSRTAVNTDGGSPVPKDEYVRGDVYTNTVEGFFSLLKRGVNGVYHHVSRAHLSPYCAPLL
jgi:hypothetical protein